MTELIFLAWLLLKIACVLLPLIVAIAYLTYAERKIIGFMQDRLGPNRVGPYGLLQPIADGLKLFFKELILPAQSNRYLFRIAPVLSFAPALGVWAVIPFGSASTHAYTNFLGTGPWVIADLNAGLLFILAMTSFSVYGVLIAGWASNSKYALLGTLRSAAQMISYEIPMGLAFAGVLIAAQSANLGDIVRLQSGGIWHWYVIPLFPLCVIHWISALAETNRSPFDLAEGESEIVAGFHVEYSGMAFAFFFLAEYANMILMAMLMALFYFGGWHSPFEGLGWLETLFQWVPGLVWLFLKAGFFILLYLWSRATFPRYRYDQLMRLGWKVFIPIALCWILILAAMVKLHVAPWFS